MKPYKRKGRTKICNCPTLYNNPDEVFKLITKGPLKLSHNRIIIPLNYDSAATKFLVIIAS